MKPHNINLSDFSEKFSRRENTQQVNRLNLGRVVDIILSEEHPDFEKYGKYQSLGVIKFKYLDSNLQVLNTQEDLVAYPEYINILTLPVKDEIVKIGKKVQATTDKDKRSTDRIVYSYTPEPINIWNNPNWNVLPDTNKKPSKKTYTFEPNSEVSSQKYESGDTLIQGRYGHSIRFGKTEEGHPAILLENGRTSEIGYIPIKEDIEKGLTSLYLLSNQETPNILLGDIDSVIPELTKKYKGSHLLGNTSKLIFNGRESFGLTAGKYGFIGTDEKLGIYSPTLNLEGNKIHLGKQAQQEREPGLLGDTTIKWLEELIGSLDRLSSDLIKATPDPVSLSAILVKAGTTLKLKSTKLEAKLNTLKSKKVFIS